MSIWRNLHEHSLGKPRKEEGDIYARMFEAAKVFETILNIKPGDLTILDMPEQILPDLPSAN